MTEHVCMKDVTVHFWISDYGQLQIEVTSGGDCIVMDIKKVISGRIPWKSMGGNGEGD